MNAPLDQPPDEPPEKPQPGQATPIDQRPDFHGRFAVVAGAVAGVVAIVAIWAFGVFGSLRVASASWDELNANAQFAARVTAVLVGFGAITLAVGAWMALVEWRGLFKPTGELVPKGMGEASKVVEAVGKLRGAALVMVVGALLMLGAAWVASSAVEAPSESDAGAACPEEPCS